jgi:hypothetical protein
MNVVVLGAGGASDRRILERALAAVPRWEERDQGPTTTEAP